MHIRDYIRDKCGLNGDVMIIISDLNVLGIKYSLIMKANKTKNRIDAYHNGDHAFSMCNGNLVIDDPKFFSEKDRASLFKINDRINKLARVYDEWK